MTTIVGWLAALTAITLGAPQVVRLIRTRSTAGLSIIAWQASLAISIAWTVHGVLIDALNMIVPNAFAAFPATGVLMLVMRERRLNPIRLFAPSAVIAAAMIATDLVFGSAGFGVVAVVVAATANAGQGLELVRSPSIAGVSPGFLMLQLANQAVWLVWALLVDDPGTLITSICTGLIALFNVVWWALRRSGLRPMFVRSSAAPVSSGEDAQVSSAS